MHDVDRDRDTTAARPHVAVVGGGISGLAAAWRLAAGEPACAVTLLEGRDAVGGILRLGDVAGMTLDLGAESLLARRPEAVDLIRDAGLGDDLVHPATSAASVVARGELHPLPSGTVMGVPASPAAVRGVLTPDEVARVAREPRVAADPLDGDVDVASLVTARLGRAVVDRLVEPLLGGVYAGRADRLSLQATLPALWEPARRGQSLLAAAAAATTPPPGAPPPGPVFAGLRGGIGRLPIALEAGLSRRGVRVCTGSTVRALRRTPSGWRLEIGAARSGGAGEQSLEVDAVILAVPPAAAARLLSGDVPAAAAELAAVTAASVAVVSAVLTRDQLSGLTGSGLLVPPIEGHAIKAATFSSQKWDWVAALDPSGRLAAVRVSLGRAGDEAVLQRDDEELAALAVRELGRVTGRSLAPVATRVTRWGGGLPQYGVGHVDRVARIRAAVAASGRLATCGAWLDGVGVPTCVAAATRAAEDVKAAFGSPGDHPTPADHARFRR